MIQAAKNTIISCTNVPAFFNGTRRKLSKGHNNLFKSAFKGHSNTLCRNNGVQKH